MSVENSLSTPDAELRAAEIRRQSLHERMIANWFSQIEFGRLTVIFPSGTRRVFGSENADLRALLQINDLRLARRMLLSGDLGLAESYMDGDWESPNLASLLMIGVLNADALAPALTGTWLTWLRNKLHHARRANTKKGSRRNIAAHYDLGNDFYGLWLDPSMTYSSAVFERFDESLQEAQARKYRRIAQALELCAEDRVLEIGCGWGGFAELAAREYGCRIVCLTLSQEQADYARKRIAQAGLSDKVDIRIQDYRDAEGTFDKIVSIEMFEAVGEANWRTFFGVLRRCLSPRGRASVQTITIDEAYFDNYRRTPDFIQRYIFPGGMLPSPTAFDAALSAQGLSISDVFYFGRSYAETLRRWDAAFQNSWPAIERFGFDERFRRMWRYYLAYCEVGFDGGKIDVGQFVIARS